MSELLAPGPSPWRRVVSVLALVVLLAMGVLYTNHVEGRLKCQARYNEALNARTRALTEATDLERRADRAEDKARADLFTNPALLKPASRRTAAESELLRELALAWQRALTEEQRQQTAADKERREHPVPPPPSELCG